MLKYFKYDHLPPHLQHVSKPFHDLAVIVNDMEPSLMREVSLQKLLEAKDAAVRAVAIG